MKNVFYSSTVLISCICISCFCSSWVVPGHISYTLFAVLLKFTSFLPTYTQNASLILESYLILNLLTRSANMNIFVKNFLSNQAYLSLSTSHFIQECMKPPFVARSRTFPDFSILSQYAGLHITDVDDPVSILICFFISIACANQ